MRHLALAGLLCALAPAARGEEGLWTYDAFPADQVAQAYGFRPDAAWLARARLASLRVGGASGAFVSPSGLVMTNHHVARGCIADLSTAERDLARDGFWAATAAEERRCPRLEATQLLEITDVTARVQRAVAGLSGEAFGRARRAESARLERECQTAAELRCQVVELHRGGRYHLYRSRRHDDVRLVFAPEAAIAGFGGDPDNFMFPRYCLDVAFLRVWEDGRPLASPDHLGWSAAGPAEGELTFVSGHPGSTARQQTVAQLELQRDVDLPALLQLYAERRGRLVEFRRRGPEEARQAAALLHGVENSLKAFGGMRAALADPAFLRKKVEEEARLRAALAKDPALAARTLPALDAIAAAQDRLRALHRAHLFLESRRSLDGDLFWMARTLVRAAEERPRPAEDRLPELRDAELPSLTRRLFSTAPIHAELETLRLAFALDKLREALGPDHPAVRRALGPASPDELAARAVQGTRLADLAYRRALWDGGQAAVEAALAQDPMLQLARALDPAARAVRRQVEDEVEAVVTRGAAALAQARLALFGAEVYPDATSTLRLSYGKVAGWQEAGEPVPPFTRLGGAFERATGREPFALPPRWLAARQALELATPFDFSSTHDITGGSSGSPVFNRKLEVVGVAFDGNLWSLGGHYLYEVSRNRMVSVHSAAILEALSRIYRAERLVRELRPPSGR